MLVAFVDVFTVPDSFDVCEKHEMKKHNVNNRENTIANVDVDNDNNDDDQIPIIITIIIIII